MARIHQSLERDNERTDDPLDDGLSSDERAAGEQPHPFGEPVDTPNDSPEPGHAHVEPSGVELGPSMRWA